MTSFTARTPFDLLAVVPIVIGFHPEDSAVLLSFGASRSADGAASVGTEALQARVDLPASDHEQRTVASMLRGVAAQHGVQVAALVLYSEDTAAASNFADLLVPGLLADGVDVIDVLRTDGTRYYVLADPSDPGMPYDLASHPFIASGALGGRVVHESRAALQDSLIGTDDDDADAVALAASAFVDQMLVAGGAGRSMAELLADEAQWLQCMVAALIAGRDPLAAPEAARLLVLLSFDSLREIAWVAMDRRNARDQVEIWRSLIRRAPADLRAGVGALLGLAAWLSGDGALAWCALDRCLACDPDDQLAQHVATLLETAAAPTVWAPRAASSLPVLALRGSDRAAVS